MLTRLSVLALLVVQGGCIAFYVPDPSRAATRGAIEDEDLRPFQIGVTRREDVLLALGEPDLRTPDDSAYLYWWYGYRGFLLFIMGTPAGKGVGIAGMIGKRISLALKFDSEGKVARHKFIYVDEGGEDPPRPVPTPKEILTQW